MTDQERLVRMYKRLDAAVSSGRAVFTDLLQAMDRLDTRGYDRKAAKLQNAQRVILLVALHRYDTTVSSYYKNLSENDKD